MLKAPTSANTRIRPDTETSRRFVDSSTIYAEPLQVPGGVGGQEAAGHIAKLHDGIGFNTIATLKAV